MKQTAVWPLALAGLLGAGQPRATAAEEPASQPETAVVTTRVESDAPPAAEETPGRKHTAIVIRKIESADEVGRSERKDSPWLGVATDEASEALTSQLGLDPGVGLVVTYVAADSPAAKAGLQKNDVLVEFANQTLVHPAQLRKLVQVRKEGDAIQLGFCRAGKKQTATATLAKTAAGLGKLEEDRSWQGDLRDLQRQLRNLPIGDAIRDQIQLRNLPIGDAIRDQMKTLRESLGNLKIDQEQVREQVRRSMEEARKALRETLRNATNAAAALGPARQRIEEVRRSMEEARKALREALRNATNAAAALGPARQRIEELSRADAAVPDDATVTVRNSGSLVKSLVRADESGTIVIVNQPKLHLTAHDKDGNLVFDGEIETPNQRAKVPRALWEKVEPLLKKEALEDGKETAPKPASSNQPPPPDNADAFLSFS